MKRFDYKSSLEFYAEDAVAALYWCDNPNVYVNQENQEVDWLYDKNGQWKPLWKVLGYYPYTTKTFINRDEEISEFNFCIGDFNSDETRGLARLLRDVWFGYVEKRYKKSDNKTALKLQNRLTGQVVYMGWYDGRFTVTKREADPDPDFHSKMLEINED